MEHHTHSQQLALSRASRWSYTQLYQNTLFNRSLTALHPTATKAATLETCSTPSILSETKVTHQLFLGIQTESVYPYTGKVGTCRFAVGLFRIRESGAISKGVCSSMEAYLIMRPVSVAVDGQNFAKYSSGIFDNCGNNLSLAALLVGGTNSYYKLKLSWGTSWGEGGYIRLLRTTDYNNICGICDAASVPIPF